MVLRLLPFSLRKVNLQAQNHVGLKWCYDYYLFLSFLSEPKELKLCHEFKAACFIILSGIVIIQKLLVTTGNDHWSEISKNTARLLTTGFALHLEERIPTRS